MVRSTNLDKEIFSTRISLAMRPRIEEFNSLIDDVGSIHISVLDDPVIQMMKMMRCSDNNFFLQNISSDRIYFKTRRVSNNGMAMIHSDLSTTIATVYTEKSVWVEISVSDEEDITQKKVYNMWFDEMNYHRNKKIEFLYYDGNNMRNNKVHLFRSIRMMWSIRMEIDKWFGTLTVFSSMMKRRNPATFFMDVAREQYMMTAGALSKMEDSVLVTDTLALINKEMTLSEMDSFLANNKLFGNNYRLRAVEVARDLSVETGALTLEFDTLETMADMEMLLFAPDSDDNSEDADMFMQMAQDEEEELNLEIGLNETDEIEVDEINNLSAIITNRSEELKGITIKDNPMDSIMFGKAINSAINHSISTEISIDWKLIKALKEQAKKEKKIPEFWNRIFTEVAHEFMNLSDEMVLKIFKHLEILIGTRMSVIYPKTVSMTESYRKEDFKAVLIKKMMNESEMINLLG
jgi:hypothetical protein